jgi:hypothetical protein
MIFCLKLRSMLSLQKYENNSIRKLQVKNNFRLGAESDEAQEGPQTNKLPVQLETTLFAYQNGRRSFFRKNYSPVMSKCYCASNCANAYRKSWSTRRRGSRFSSFEEYRYQYLYLPVPVPEELVRLAMDTNPSPQKNTDTE